LSLTAKSRPRVNTASAEITRKYTEPSG